MPIIRSNMPRTRIERPAVAVATLAAIAALAGLFCYQLDYRLLRRWYWQILVVAEKYQTGFDQPKLYAMYVDKVLTGLAAGADERAARQSR